MKTLFEVATNGDSMTMPGGIAVRFNDGNSYHPYQVHNFNESLKADGQREYFGGGYYSTLSEALYDFTRRVQKAESYTAGGSLVAIAA